MIIGNVPNSQELVQLFRDRGWIRTTSARIRSGTRKYSRRGKNKVQTMATAA